MARGNQPELTDRQKQIKAMIDQGKDPADIAKKLKITRNGVYQQIRRLRAAGALPAKAGSNGGRKSGNQRRPQAPARRPAPAPVVEHEDPLTAVKARKAEVAGEIKDLDRALTEAQATVAKLQKRVEDDTAKLVEELRRLEASEEILSGKRSATSGSRPTSRSRRRPARTTRRQTRERGSQNGSKAGSQEGAAATA